MEILVEPLLTYKVRLGLLLFGMIHIASVFLGNLYLELNLFPFLFFYLLFLMLLHDLHNIYGILNHLGHEATH